jgi:hypothetical protein
MYTSFRRLISSAQLSALSELKNAHHAVRILECDPEPLAPSFKHGTGQSVAEFYIAEIDRVYSYDWMEKRDVARMGAHHAREVAGWVASYANCWPENCFDGGIRNQPAFIRNQIDGLIDRVCPALYAAEKEYDPDCWLRERYNEIEQGARATLADIEARYKAEREFASAHKRKKIRAQEAAELQVLLDGLAAELKQWAAYFPEHRLP